MKEYDHKKIEKKWQGVWKKKKIYKTSDNSKKKKFYILDMFPYVSGEGIHVGHPKGYIATDVVSRMKRMQGFNVLHPMGFDAFGLPAENYAIKTKTNPVVSVAKNIVRFKKQLEIIGFDYDWEREVNTSDPKFYKWTQWIFLRLLEKGLAYESNEPVNWCPTDKTVLANEDVEDGKCERCGTVVEKKPIRQWVLKITDYAERLLSDLDALDWPESIKESQRNWIGKSEGLIFSAKVKGTNITIQTFSAHFEACFADTFFVIAPDHPLLPELLEGSKDKDVVLKKAKEIIAKRNALGEKYKEIDGIFTGRYAVDPLGNGDLPIWVGGFALANYGTGIVKCSAHDERDFAFAKKYNIKLKTVLYPQDLESRKKVESSEVCFSDMKNGILIEPKDFSGKNAGEARKEISEWLVKKGFAVRKTTYRLRDWVFSRQRYWGEPIPVLRDGNEIIPVKDKDLPVKLPKVKFYEPTGTAESPLAGLPNWINVKIGKKVFKRESNTMPQWAGSSWYYLRYMDPKNNKALVDKKKEKYWNMVDLYVGGAEHAARHLIYARFWHKFLYDIGVVATKEPFKRLQDVGLIIASDGRKMSKRFGNIVSPDTVINTFGADTLRLYEMFMGPFDQSVAWSTDSMVGPRRFLERVWKVKEHVSKNSSESVSKLLNKTIKKVSEDIEAMRFNTAVSSMMVLLNEIDKSDLSIKDYKKFLQILSPFAPHITEELWSLLGEKKSINLSAWPAFDESLTQDEEIKIAIQVNGKVRAEMMIRADENEEDIKKRALAEDAVVRNIAGGEVKKVIHVKNRLVNIVL